MHSNVKGHSYETDIFPQALKNKQKDIRRRACRTIFLNCEWPIGVCINEMSGTTSQIHKRQTFCTDDYKLLPEVEERRADL